MIEINLDYKINEDLNLLEDLEKVSDLELSALLYVSRVSINEIGKTKKEDYELLDKIYSYIYKKGYRLNKTKTEFLLESNPKILFHGSKNGLNFIKADGSKGKCDFGNGFYLGENYEKVLSFISTKDKSCVYSFKYNLDGLKIKKFNTSLEWMLAVCYYRGNLKQFENHKIIKELIDEINSCDLIIAPIADNRMFHIMNLFSDGEINCDTALHSLSASDLGFQYVLKTEKAIDRLVPVEKYFISSAERENINKKIIERSFDIDTKLKLAKREYRNGLYIEEILK